MTSETTPDPQVCRLLFVHRDPALADRVRGLLGCTGNEEAEPNYRVAHLTHLSDALTYLKISPVDLVLIGPDPAGSFLVEAIAELSALHPEVPVVALLSSPTRDERHAVRQAGARECLLADEFDFHIWSRTFEFCRREMTLSRELAEVNTDLGHSKLVTEEQNRSRRELLHVLCHDLANPLTSIQEAVRQLQVNKEHWELLFPILSLSSQNAVDVIELVRQIQVIEDRPMDLHTVNLRHAADSAATLLRGQLERKRISLEIDIDESLQVIAEPTSLISSVLSNILTNAIKFSPAGERVLLQASVRDSRIYVRCIDHGVGMSEEIRQSLFDLGKNISRAGTDGEMGTGFGMPMVKKFVTAYGGTIEVQSVDDDAAPTRGTAVLVILPHAKPPQA